MIHNNGTLVITGILQQDAGMYVCQAKNVLGMAKSTNLLIVHGMNNANALTQNSPHSSIIKIVVVICKTTEKKHYLKKVVLMGFHLNIVIHLVLSTVLTVRTTLYSIINSTT